MNSYVFDRLDSRSLPEKTFEPGSTHHYSQYRFVALKFGKSLNQRFSIWGTPKLKGVRKMSNFTDAFFI